MFKDTFNLIEGESLTTSPRTKDAQSLAEMFTSEGPTVPQVPQVPLMDPSGNQINTGNLINPSDASQLAKSGNIDITEAIAARRT